MSYRVDSYRFLRGISRRMIKHWVGMEKPRPIPWTPLPRSLAACTVALVSSGGIVLRTDTCFDQELEREQIWCGDPSYRTIPLGTSAADIRVDHLHINPAFAEADLDCLLPVARLAELAASGMVGRAAPTHYSFMGYTLQPQSLLEESTPAMIRQMQAEAVDAVVLVPA